MKWMKERDLLIAQTLAFVQSVSGKFPETEATIAAPVVAPPAANNETARAASIASIAPLQAETAPPPLQLQVEAPAAAAVTVVIPAPPVEVSTGAAPQMPKPALPLRPDWREDFQSEIRARVANFRAQQERFSREREAYCTATMARVHATLKEGELPPPPRFVK